MLRAGDVAPSFSLPDTSGATVEDPWREGSLAIVFFKVSCPVCQMVGPVVGSMGQAGLPTIAVGQDPVPALVGYAARFDQPVRTLSEPAPYEVSTAFGITSVPSLFLVGADGKVADSVGAWDRERWNRVATALGGPEVSYPGDGLPPYRPG